jgi:hypothetical protein
MSDALEEDADDTEFVSELEEFALAWPVCRCVRARSCSRSKHVGALVCHGEEQRVQYEL